MDVKIGRIGCLVPGIEMTAIVQSHWYADVYLYRLGIGNYSVAKKMVLLQ